jgi:8-oxo-dGTP diphosphatase
MTGRELLVQVILFCLRDDLLQILLCPSGEKWSLPGEEPRAEESLDGTARRIIAAQVDRRESYLEQLYTYGESGPVRVVSFALVPGEARLLPGQAGRWFPAVSLPGLAEDHPEILAYALRRLRYKLEYSAVGFLLLPAEFTLTELQHTYEIILDEKLDKRNFRRRILQSGIIENTPRQRSGEGRPARLYRYRADAVAEVKARRLFP